MSEQELLAAVELHGRALSVAVKAAENAGVSPALVLPTLFTVFRDAGMIPDSLDLGSIMGLVGG